MREKKKDSDLEKVHKEYLRAEEDLKKAQAKCLSLIVQFNKIAVHQNGRSDDEQLALAETVSKAESVLSVKTC
jgi:hypothetical protein